MEYTNDLSIFEGFVDAADDVISISDIVEKAGNERKMDFLLKRVQDFIKEVEYLQNGEYKKDVQDKLRQLALFVIFNSDLPVLEKMKDYPSLELLIGSLPTLPRYVMCEILWNLNIDDIIGEILVCTYPILAVDITKSFIEHFKYFLPDNCLHRLHMLTASCYKLIHQMLSFKVDEGLVNQAYDNFILCNKYFLDPPNSHKLDTLSEDDLFKLMGDRIYAFLCVLNECFEVFTTKEYQTPQINDIYLSTMQENILKEERLNLCDIDKDKDIRVIKESLLNCNIALLDTCKSLLSEVSIDIFCSWSEFEENGVSLQNKIGDLSYTIKRKHYEFVNHIEQVWVMLQLIATKPKDLKEEINKFDSKTIEEKIKEDTNESVEWLKYLIYRKDICTEDNLLREMYKRINLLNDYESLQLYNIVYDHLKTNTGSNNEFLKSLSVKCFENCANDVKVNLVAKHFTNNVFSDTMETEMFESMATTIFNKLISLPESELSQIYDIFLQSPKKVLKKVFVLASESLQQTNIMVKVMVFLNEYSNYKYNNETESCAFLTAKEIIDSDFDTEKQRDNFIMFVDKLKHNKILLEQKLLHIIIMPSIHIGLKTNDIDKLYFHCKLLHKAFKSTEYVQYRAPMLIMLAQIVETVRWNMISFSALRPTVLDLALELVASVFCSYDTIPEKDRVWMRMKLRNMNPLNMYYYRCLWDPPGSNFIEVISGTHLHEEINNKRIVLWLTQQLCSTSLLEWNNMWSSLEIFKTNKIVDFFHTAIMLIVATEKEKRTIQSEACLLYCLGNYISILKNKYLQPPIDDIQVENVGAKLVALENSIEISNIEDIQAILLPILSYIAERRHEYSVDMSVSLHCKLKHKKIKDACNGFFSK